MCTTLKNVSYSSTRVKSGGPRKTKDGDHGTHPSSVAVLLRRVDGIHGRKTEKAYHEKHETHEKRRVDGRPSFAAVRLRWAGGGLWTVESASPQWNRWDRSPTWNQPVGDRASHPSRQTLPQQLPIEKPPLP